MIDPTTAIAEIALVIDISGVCSRRDTRRMTPRPMNEARTNTYKVGQKSVVIFYGARGPTPARHRALERRLSGSGVAVEVDYERVPILRLAAAAPRGRIAAGAPFLPSCPSRPT